MTSLTGLTGPAVSIVLPTRNGMATLPALMNALDHQHVGVTFETLAIDSSSTDGTADFLRSRVDRFLSIPAEQFDHGLTRNLAIQQSQGALVVLLVQDALPASSGWLAALTAPFATDLQLAGAFARQVPRPDTSAIARHYLAQWAASSDRARTTAIVDRREFDSLEPAAKLERCTFDNVCSCIRRSVWNEHPFRPTPIGEDVEWAKEVLLAGYHLAYVPAAEVIHSHDRPVDYEFVRTYQLHRRLYELFGLQTIPGLPHLGRSIASSLALHLECRGNGVSQLTKAVALAFAWPLGQYLGARSAARGQRSPR